jgi:hypothetical protein
MQDEVEKECKTESDTSVATPREVDNPRVEPAVPISNGDLKGLVPPTSTGTGVPQSRVGDPNESTKARGRDTGKPASLVG